MPLLLILENDEFQSHILSRCVYIGMLPQTTRYNHDTFLLLMKHPFEYSPYFLAMSLDCGIYAL